MKRKALVSRHVTPNLLGKQTWMLFDVLT
uniref:Uncharacterized protein n=1 Tax=Arundo donax TaxID=35708 RepID=A0A0A8YTZ1_ARUDO